MKAAHQSATDGSGGVSARRSRAPQRAHSDARERGAQATTRRWRRISRRSVVVEALLDELLLDAAPVRIEARELEVLLEFEVDVVLATAVLLDRDHDPVAEALAW